MGESYRGLTVKFGGDTTSLQSALKSATYTISSTQSELRKLQSALKFDPSSILAVNSKMQLMSERASACYQKIYTMRQSLNGMSAEQILKMANSFEGVNFNVAETIKRFDSLDNALKKTKDEINKMSSFEVFDKDNKLIDGMLEKFEQLGAGAKALADKYRNLASEWKVASAAMESSKEKAKLQDLASELIKVTAETRNLRQEFVSLSGSSLFSRGEADAQKFVYSLKDIDAAITQCESESKKLNNALHLDTANIEIAKNYISSTKDEIAQLDAKAKLLNERMKSLGSGGIEEMSKNAREVRENFIRAADDLSKITAEIGQARVELSSMKSEQAKMLSEGKEQSSEYRKLSSAISSAESELKGLFEVQKNVQASFDTAQACTEYRRLGTEIQEVKAKSNSLKSELNGLNSAAKVNASTFTTLGMALTFNLTPYMLMFGHSAVEAAQEIDSAYRDMRKTVTGSEEDFQALKDAAMDFASTHVTSADQILEIQAMGGQLGLAVESLESFSTTIANLNVATNITDAQTAAQQLGQLANIMSDLNSDTFPSFGDALVRLGNNNAALESDIVDVTARIGSMGSILGFTTPQLLAWSTAIAATGQGSEAAGTAISKTMSDIETAVSEGGESLEAFAQVSGRSAEEFASLWKSSPSDALKSFIEGLNRIKVEGGSVDGTLENLGITAVRQKQALEGLTQTVGGLDDSLTMSQHAWEGVGDKWGEAGDAANEATKKAQGFSGQLSILQNNAQMVGAEFAESLAPVLGIVNGFMQALYDIVKDMPDGVKLLTLAFMTLAASVGPLSTLIGPIVNVYRQLNSEERRVAQTLSSANAELRNAGKAGETAAAGAEKAAKGASKATIALKALGGALASVIVIEAVSYIASLVNEQIKLEKSTHALRDALKDNGAKEYSSSMDKVSESIGVFSESISSTIQDLSKVNEAIKESAEKHTSLAQTISKKWSEVKANESLVDSYASTIENLSGKCEGNAEKLHELKVAIDGYNSITGSSIEITDNVSGAINKETDELKNNTEEWKKNAEAQVKQELYEIAYRQKYIDLQNVTNAAREYNEALSTLNRLQQYGAEHTFASKEEYDKYAASVTAAQLAVNESAKSLKAANNLYEDSSEAVRDCSDAMEDGTTSLDDYDSALQTASETLGMTKDAIIELAASFGISGADGIKLFAESIANGIPQTQAAVMALTGMTTEAFNEVKYNIGNSAYSAMQLYEAGIAAGYTPAYIAALLVEGGVEDAFYQGEGGALKAAQNTSSAYGGAIDSASGIASENASIVANGVVSTLDVSSEAGSIGDNISSTFASNISNWASQAINNAIELARGVIDGLRSGAEVNSPSKAAMRVVKSIAQEGFIEQFPQYYDEAFKSGQELGASAIGGLESRMTDGLAELNYLVEGGVSSLYDNARESLNASLSESVTVVHQIPDYLDKLSNNNNAREIGKAVAGAMENANIGVYVDSNKLVGATLAETQTQLASLKVRSNR